MARNPIPIVTAAEARKLLAPMRRAARRLPATHDDQAAAKKPRKYGNEPVVVDGMRFDSGNEYSRWCHLRMLVRAREITDLQRQVPFELAPAAVYGGTKHRPMVYVADFTYRERGKFVVEDVKGVRTEGYRLKRHLMATVHGIDIREIQAR